VISSPPPKPSLKLNPAGFGFFHAHKIRYLDTCKKNPGKSAGWRGWCNVAILSDAPARGPLKKTLPLSSVCAVTAWNHGLDCFSQIPTTAVATNQTTDSKVTRKPATAQIRCIYTGTLNQTAHLPRCCQAHARHVADSHLGRPAQSAKGPLSSWRRRGWWKCHPRPPSPIHRSN
jgi:hypothetical protein